MRSLLTIEEVAEIFGVVPATVRNWIRKGNLEAIQVGKSYLVRSDFFKEYIDQDFLGRYHVEVPHLPTQEDSSEFIEATKRLLYHTKPTRWARKKEKLERQTAFSDLLSVAEAAQFLSVSLGTIHNWIEKGIIKAIVSQGVGGRKKYLISKDELEPYLSDSLEILPPPIAYDEEDKDLVEQGGWRYDQGSKRIVRFCEGTVQQLHRLIAQRMQDEPLLVNTKIHFRDENPYNVRRNNLIIGSPLPVYTHYGNLLYLELSSGLTVRISQEDAELFQQCRWYASFRGDKTLWNVLTNSNPQRLIIRVAERMKERKLHAWEEVQLRDGDPNHCERENIIIGYKQSYLDLAYVRYDTKDADLFRKRNVLLAESSPGNFYVVYRESNKTFVLHREIMARKLGRDLFPFEIVKHYNEDQLDLRRENLYIPD